MSNGVEGVEGVDVPEEGACEDGQEGEDVGEVIKMGAFAVFILGVFYTKGNQDLSRTAKTFSRPFLSSLCPLWPRAPLLATQPLVSQTSDDEDLYIDESYPSVPRLQRHRWKQEEIQRPNKARPGFSGSTTVGEGGE